MAPDADPSKKTGIAIVGCGFVSDYYISTLENHRELELIGVADRDAERLAKYAQFHSVTAYDSLDELLDDARVGIVVNLTNPRSHYEVSKACLNAGKHVYSEKPLAMRFADAEELVALAEEKGLYIAGAPCTVLSETAQTVWKALRSEAVGQVRLVYAEIDEGMLHVKGYDWTSPSGAKWPWKDEFEVGCTLEHAGYYVTWLTAFFGPVETVTAFAKCTVSDKKTAAPLDVSSPDLSVACLEFKSGVVARLTCSIVGPENRDIQIVGDKGCILVHDCWDFGAKVFIDGESRWNNFLNWFRPRLRMIRPLRGLASRLRNRPTEYPLVRPSNFKCYPGNKMDFARGVAELAAAVEEGRPCRLSARYTLHVIEVVLTMQYPEEMGCPRKIVSSFEPVEPMPWAMEKG